MRIFFTALTALALSSSAPAADLLQVYRDALAQDPVYAAARAQYQAGLEKLPQGRALLLPTLNLSSNTTWNETESTFSGTTTQQGGERQFNSHAYTLTLTQPLYRKQNFAQYQQGKLQVTQAEAQFSTAGQELILRVAQAYFDILLAQDNVELVGAQKAAIAEQLAQAKRNFEVGTATITDTHEAQARFDLVTSQEIAALNDLEIKKRTLQQIIGKAPEALHRLGVKFALTLPQPNNMDKWVEEADNRSLQIMIQQAVFDIAQQEVERNRGGHLPTLDLVATRGDSSANASSNFNAGSDIKTSTIGLQLSLPIFQGGGQISRVREAVANQEKARQDLENTRRGAALQTRQAFLGVTNGVAQVKALEQALVSSQSQLDSTKLGQEVGVRTGVDVLNAQQQLYSARRDLYQARYNTILNQLRLKSAVGSLTEEDLKQVNQALQ